MAKAEERRPPLRAEDWTHAALTAIGAGGLPAVAVEKLAATLGATKGSFYWHFTSRRALIDAALDRWEQQHTDRVIAAMERIDRPEERLDELLAIVLEHRADPVELALLSAAQDPKVGAAVARVTQRRIDYVATLYEASGYEPEAARSAALTAVAIYLGHLQLAHAAPTTLPTCDQWTAHQERVRGLLRP